MLNLNGVLDKNGSLDLEKLEEVNPNCTGFTYKSVSVAHGKSVYALEYYRDFQFCGSVVTVNARTGECYEK